MKLIDILVEELPKRGGWPAGYKSISQDGTHSYHKGNIYAYINPLNRTRYWVEDHNAGYGLLLFNGYEVAEDASTSLVNRQQYEAALAAKNEGWIEWRGGECPLHHGAIVDVKLRNGRTEYAQEALSMEGYASYRFWRKDNTSGDIIAYRLHKPQEAAQTEADDEADLNECIGQDAAPVWGGEGKPAIGEKCEHHSGDQWEAVTIAGIYENLVTGFTDYWMVKEDGSSYMVGNPYRFRPIRSESDKRREEAIKDMTLTGWCESAAEEMYDLIAAGKVRGVKLED